MRVFTIVLFLVFLSGSLAYADTQCVNGCESAEFTCAQNCPQNKIIPCQAECAEKRKKCIKTCEDQDKSKTSPSPTPKK